jgi:hypothetical protein
MSRLAALPCRSGRGPAIALFLALATLAGCAERSSVGASLDKPVAARTIVLGFDGLDPDLTEAWMAEGKLPHFAALAKTGHYQRLGTTVPPQSPVAWASFATGNNPGRHRIFDFLQRDPGN